jgi:uncharacterized protein (TIGR03000 family)
VHFDYAGPVVVNATVPVQATVEVHVPAEAKLYVDGHLADLASATRTFQTPPLQPGRQYYYTIKVEVERAGTVVTRNQRVIVEGGKLARVDFGDLTTTPVVQSQPPVPAAMGSKPATVEVSDRTMTRAGQR